MPGRKFLVPHSKTSIPFVTRMGGIHSDKKKNQTKLNNSQLDHHKQREETLLLLKLITVPVRLSYQWLLCMCPVPEVLVVE